MNVDFQWLWSWISAEHFYDAVRRHKELTWGFFFTQLLNSATASDVFTGNIYTTHHTTLSHRYNIHTSVPWVLTTGMYEPLLTCKSTVLYRYAATLKVIIQLRMRAKKRYVCPSGGCNQTKSLYRRHDGMPLHLSLQGMCCLLYMLES